MRPHIKFCGMTREADIEAVEALGVDFIGFIFVESSPRFVTIDRAKTLRRSVGKAKVVGVLGNTSVEEIGRYVEEVGLDAIQLHGEPDLALCKNITDQKKGLGSIQAFTFIPSEAIIRDFLIYCDYILIDKSHGAKQSDFGAIASLPEDIRKRLFLAGGLHPLNVHSLVDHIHPFAVDCARGIESSPGVKDLALMRSFLSHLSS